MILTGNERMQLLDILTNMDGNYEFLRNIIVTRENIEFTPNEVLRLDLRTVNGKVYYDTKILAKLSKDIPIDDWSMQFLHDRIQSISDQNKLSERMMSLYEKFVSKEKYLPELDDATDKKLRSFRKGKKTVAIVGFANDSVSLAPYNDDSVEVWGLNEAHAFQWMKRATRWFQLHDTYKQKLAKRGITTHHEWLKENKWNIPIYMISKDDEIPNSVVYPLAEVCDRFLSAIQKGDSKVKYFGSTFDYMMAIALLEDFDRIEIYGVNMESENEYSNQKPSAEFWIGLALGKGVEIYLPPGCALMNSKVYGGLESFVM